MYITIDELQKFANKYVDEADAQMLEVYCNAAMEAVKKYLGYSPEQSEYTEKIKSDGKNQYIALSAMPIVEIKSVILSGLKLAESDFDTVKNYLKYYDESYFVSGIYEINYVAGFENVPYIIKLTALQIASLLWETSGGNLAVNSTSFADAGTRVFNNFKIDRFLEQISDYRIIKL